MHRKIGLDMARVGAVALVLVSHFVARLEFLGIFGVELFFALSGYLIGGILYRNLAGAERWSMADVGNFWARRWWRTLPNYYLFLAVALVFHYFYGGLPGLAEIPAYLVFAQNLMNGSNPFYGVSWSLAVEEWFYLSFPLALLLLTWMGCGKRQAFALTTLLFLSVPPLLREMAFSLSEPARVRLMTLPRLDAIFYGVATAFFVSRHGTTRRARLAAACLGAATVLVFFGLFGRGPGHEGLYRAAFVALPLGFSLCLPFLGCVDRLAPGLDGVAKAITHLSLWSYSIYLSHIPVLFSTYALFGHHREQPLINALSKLVGLALCIVVSKVIYERFERPFTALRPPDRSDAGPAAGPGAEAWAAAASKGH